MEYFSQSIAFIFIWAGYKLQLNHFKPIPLKYFAVLLVKLIDEL